MNEIIRDQSSDHVLTCFSPLTVCILLMKRCWKAGRDTDNTRFHGKYRFVLGFMPKYNSYFFVLILVLLFCFGFRTASALPWYKADAVITFLCCLAGSLGPKSPNISSYDALISISDLLPLFHYFFCYNCNIISSFPLSFLPPALFARGRVKQQFISPFYSRISSNPFVSLKSCFYMM